jgi:hypothetical protein
MSLITIRFGELTVGSDFEWGGRSMRKESDYRAMSLVPRQEFFFKKSDLVKVQVQDPVIEDDDFYPMYGLSGQGSASPSNTPDQLTSDDLTDAYCIPFAPGVCD